MLPTSRLDASINLALEAAARDDEVVLVDADTYGGAVAHANIQEPRRKRPWDKGRPWLCDSEGPGS